MFECPKCKSKNTVELNYAKRVAGGICMASSFVASLRTAFTGAQVGMRVGFIAGPVGVPTGAVIGAIAGGLAGYKLGAKFGEVIDQNILDNCQCLACGYKFSCTENKN
ncbi:hypothetical protein DS2_14709 [Catenovulum agarivorans DS-2]|uniref:Glycine zipper domain-containing protein n=1 Tax=Catenovulum agarivorans DS-2 TaxID=1328313 RepID=W7Q880_9ALTE|nr:hypothetical protein [Catenovulum agarivorans]EWH09034.1 hypothetical protein DS2_14709 [Catenovulum agarivorans DS-2]